MGIYGTYGAFNGLGKPSIKLEFEDNESLIAFSKKMQDDGNEEPVAWNEERQEFEPLEGYGDKYIVTDLRKRAKKEPGDVAANKNLKFEKQKDFFIAQVEELIANYDYERKNNNIPTAPAVEELKTHVNNYYLFANKTPQYLFMSVDEYNNNLDKWKKVLVNDVSNIARYVSYYDKIKPKGLNTGLGAPGDTYIITDTRTRARKDLEDTAAFRKFDVKKVEGGATSAAAQSDKKEWVDADDTLTRKLGEFKARQRKDPAITDAQIVAAARPYKDAALIAKANYLAFRDKRGQYLQADDRQMALFGKVANNALYNNLEILDFRGMQPTYRQLPNYDAFFKPATNKNSLKGWGLNDTKKLIADICRNHYRECAAIAKHLKAETKLQSAFNLWHWLHHNIRYEYDREGREEVRTPSRVWADRHRGVDCDCLSVFAWCVLKCMGYNPAFELVSFKGKKQPSHILVNLDGIRLDRVWFVFNSLPPGVTGSEIYRVTTNEDIVGLFN